MHHAGNINLCSILMTTLLTKIHSLLFFGNFHLNLVIEVHMAYIYGRFHLFNGDNGGSHQFKSLKRFIWSHYTAHLPFEKMFLFIVTNFYVLILFKNSVVQQKHGILMVCQWFYVLGMVLNIFFLPHIFSSI